MSGPFTPSPDDAAVAMLRMVFGPVVDQVISGNITGTATGSASMLAEAFKYLNGGVLFFGTIIITYVTLFSVVNTANDGEALGKKWSTLYTPIRTLVSTAMIIPTASGYAGIQLLVLLIVSWSIGFASNMWAAVVTQVAQTSVVEQAMSSITADKKFDELALNAIKMQICAASVNKTVNKFMPQGNQVNLTLYKSGESSSNVITFNQDLSKSFMYKDPNWPGSENLCGTITVTNTFKTPSSSSNAVATVAASVNQAVQDIRYKYVLGLFSGGIKAIADEAILAAETDGQKIYLSKISAAVAAASSKMEEEIKQAVLKQVGENNVALDKAFKDSAGGGDGNGEDGFSIPAQSSVVTKLTQKGWIYAGSLSSELASMKDAIRNATTSTSSFADGTNGDLSSFLSGPIAAAVNVDKKKYEEIGREISKNVLDAKKEAPKKPEMPTIQTNYSYSDFANGDGGVKTRFSAFFNSITNRIVGGVISYMGTDNDPVMKVKDMGDFLATSATSVIFTKQAIKISLAVAGKYSESTAANVVSLGTNTPSAVVTGLSTFVEEMWVLYGQLIYAMMYMGYFLGIWIPMIPFYIFAVGVVGWLIFVGEMMAASVLWMAAHTTPAREDSFIGSQTQGYLLMMSGFFRPALMILGLVFSMAVLNPAVTFINSAFILRFQSLQADSTTGLVSIVGYLLVYCAIIMAVFTICFSLPQSLPDRILKWIGGGVGDMGEQNTADRVGHSASGQSRMAATYAAGGTGRQAALNAYRKEKTDAADRLAAQERAEESSRSDAKSNQTEGHGSQSPITNPGNGEG